MRIIFLGTPDFAVPSLEALLDAGHEILCVVTQPDRPGRRHSQPVPTPVKAFATSRGILVRQTEDVNQPPFAGGLADLRPDLIAVAAFGQKLRRRLLGLAPHGAINVHASLLPRHRGAAPIAHAILAGDTETGVTVQRMAARLDAGDILAQEATPIGPRETAGELTDRLARLGATLLGRAVADIAAGQSHPVPQDPAKATFAPSLRKEDGAIDWTRDAAYLARLVRAMNPWPSAFTFWTPPSGAPLRLVVHDAEGPIREGEAPAEPPWEGEAPAEPSWEGEAPAEPSWEGEAPAEPGRIAAAEPSGIAVETGHGLLRLLTLQPAGGRPMSAADFLRGHRLVPGGYLVSHAPGAGQP